MRRLFSLATALALASLLVACVKPVSASPPAKPGVSKITAVAGTASATFTCNGPAACVVSDIKDQGSGTVLFHAATIPAGAQPVLLSMPCPALGGPLTWSGTVAGHTTGMNDSPAVLVSTSGSCPLATSPAASFVFSPIVIGP